ncbi:PilZ domain-containing protein [Hydrogenimonas sp. SS33]|uniref:PilZ domain-containing protein n=1 Tax=Hydrogenimonas leucolamina TaxID=2954236 RepID=UPI00336BD003
MARETFFRRLRLFRTLAVTPPGNEDFIWCGEADEGSCRRLDYEALSADDAKSPPHLVLFCYSDDPAQCEAMEAAAGKIDALRPWALLIFARKEAMASAMPFALKHHAFGLYPLSSEEAQMRAVATALPGMLERIQEQGRLTQLQKVTEMAPAEVLIGEKGQPLYLNRAAKGLFGVEEAASFGKEVLPGLALEPLEGRKDPLGVLSLDRLRLLTLRGEPSPSGERLYTFIPFSGDLDIGDTRYLSRVEFIDRLKDRLALGLEESSLSVLLVKLENFDTVARSIGWIEANAVLIRFGELLQEHFGPMEVLGLWHRDMPVAFFENRDIERLQEQIKGFVAEMKLFDFGHNVTLSAEFTLVKIGEEDLNGLINLIEKEYEGELSVRDTKAFTLYKTGSNHATPDESQLLRQFFTNIMANDLPVKLLNIYKGLPISTPTKILKMEEGKIVVKAEKLQKFVMAQERKVVFQSPHLPGDVEADIHLVDEKRPLAIVKNLRMLHSSVNNRKHTRVNVTSRLPIAISEGKKQYTGYIQDLSVNSIAVLFNAGKFEENVLREKRVEASFRLPWENEEGFVNVQVAAKILFNRDEGEHHKAVLILEPDDMTESFLFDYVYKRQKELIREIRSRIT